MVSKYELNLKIFLLQIQTVIKTHIYAPGCDVAQMGKVSPII